jgi:hypothetical protein
LFLFYLNRSLNVENGFAVLLSSVQPTAALSSSRPDKRKETTNIVVSFTSLSKFILSITPRGALNQNQINLSALSKVASYPIAFFRLHPSGLEQQRGRIPRGEKEG